MNPADTEIEEGARITEVGNITAFCFRMNYT